jgi:Winged helix-turn helix
LLSFTAYESKDNDLTQKEMATRIYQEKGILVSRQTVGRILKKHKQTRNKVTYQPCEQKFDKIRQFRRETKNLPLTQFSSLDECSFHLNEIPRYAYSPRGKRAIVLKPNKKGDNRTVIICVQRKEAR